MSEPTWIQKTGATPGKIALMGVLAMVLAAVVLYQTGDGNEAIALQPEAAKPDPNARLAEPAAGDANAQARTWPAIALKEALQHDPFATPQALAPPEPARNPAADPLPLDEHAQRALLRRAREEALSVVQEQGVQLVVLGTSENIAIVGERTIRVGDELSGFRVAAIGPNGITLEDHPFQRARESRTGEPE